jgi:iron complex transport system permease protein
MQQAAARLALTYDLLRQRPGFWGALFSGLLAAAAAVSLVHGAVDVPLDQILPSLVKADHPLHRVVGDIRLPRVLVACLAGAAFGVAGALLQTAVRNPLADASLLGVNAGAGVAALVALLFFPETTAALPVLAFLGGLAAVALVLACTWAGSSAASPLRIILSGVAIQAILFSAIAVLTFLFADRAPSFVSFTVGTLNGCGWREAAMIALPILLGLALAGLALRPLDLLLLDDDSAGGVGLPVRRSRLGAACLGALLASAAVSAVGLVGFVGLLVPNWVRLAAGPSHRSLLPLSALGGAALLLAADLGARTLLAPLELPVGALLAFLGGPYFLVLLWRKLP